MAIPKEVTNKKYRLRFIRKATSAKGMIKPLNVVLELNGQFTATQLLIGFSEWMKREPNKTFIVTNASDDNATAFTADQVQYLDVKPYSTQGINDRILLLSKQETSRLIQFMTS
ncbi:hypothetical protein CN692_10680 [Bacillus sp. AFS002410]|uniref:hypothetical protein n=1 Tax=Bacillus sp. AFS002410 TaxID=2033481 RepID=UPI000BF022D2|nr:hypothetical protein [Bacillus sp. AFS002410]PEJ57951.1 hypothetical protein CN692_10680 [Bacillus sp. AFS002410]